MKKILSLLLVAMMLVTLLASCGETPDNNTDKKVTGADIENDAYLFDFASNGDGTCSISAIGTLNYDKANKTLTIPEKSPAGDTVVSLGKISVGKFPTYLTLEDYTSLTTVVKQRTDVVSKYNFTKYFDMVFTTISLNNELLTESAKAEYIKTYPLIQYTDIVVMSKDASDREINVICGYLEGCELKVADYVKNLNKLSYEHNIKSYFLYSPDIESISFPSSLSAIGSNAFAGFSGLKSVTIPDSVTYFGERVFNGCESLATVTLGKGVSEIQDYMFQNCTSLKNIILAEGITYIGSFAFDGCTSLETVTIPASVKEIGSSAFNGCTALTSANYNGTIDQWAMVTLNDDKSAPFALTGGLTIGGKLVTEVNLTTATKVSSYAFANCTAITKVTLGESVKTIGDYAFYKCTGITQAIFAKNIKTIGNSAFEGCKEITTFTAPTELTMIRLRAFAGCTKLATVTFNSKLTTIGFAAFSETAVESIVLPNSLTNLGYSAFNNCSKLKTVVIPKSIVMLGNGVFYGTALTTINYRGTAANWADIDFAEGWMEMAKGASFQGGTGVVLNYNK